MKSASAERPFSRPQRADPLREQVYRSLHEKLKRGEIDPEARLTETQLAAMLGVSRTPVREALARLRQEGLLDLSPRGAALSSLSRTDLDEVMEMRLLLEPYIAARAAERSTADGVAALRAALAREVEAVPLRSPQRFAAANHDFRALLVAMAGNRRLAETASRFDSQLQTLRRATLEDSANRETVVRHHRALVAAIAKRDAAGAERAMRELMDRARVAVLALAPAEG